MQGSQLNVHFFSQPTFFNKKVQCKALSPWFHPPFWIMCLLKLFFCVIHSVSHEESWFTRKKWPSSIHLLSFGKYFWNLSIHWGRPTYFTYLPNLRITTNTCISRKSQGSALAIFMLFLSARRANFFSAVGKILDLVSVFCKAKKWVQNRNSNENLPCIEDITRWMSQKAGMEWSDTCKNLGYVNSCWNHWVRWGFVCLLLENTHWRLSVKMKSKWHQESFHKHIFLSLAFRSILLLDPSG